jgi:hypothetical protein
MQRTVSIYLMLSLLACPVLCAGGRELKSAASQAGPHTCSCCGDESPTSPDHSGAPDGSPAKSGRSCQCICGGAIAGDTNAHVLAFDWSWSLPVAVIEPAVAQLLEESQLRLTTAPWPDVGLNHGRALCYLFSTMQC